MKQIETDKVTQLPHDHVQGQALDNLPPMSDFNALPLTSKRLGLPVQVRMSRSAWSKVMDDVRTEAEAFGIKQTHLDHVVEIAYACISRIIPGRQHTFIPGYCDGQDLFLRGWILNRVLFIDLCPQHN